MVGAVGDVKPSPLLRRYGTENLMRGEFLFAKLLFADDQLIVHRLQFGLKPRAEGLAIKNFAGARHRGHSKRRRATGGEIAEPTDKELLHPLVGVSVETG